jgi:hypothetical protein
MNADGVVEALPVLKVFALWVVLTYLKRKKYAAAIPASTSFL